MFSCFVIVFSEKSGNQPKKVTRKPFGQKTSAVVNCENATSSGPGEKKPTVMTGGTSAEEVKELRNEICELNEKVDVISQERDFYFKKLTDIEAFLNSKKELDESNNTVLQILYAEENATVTVDEEGRVTIETPAEN